MPPRARFVCFAALSASKLLRYAAMTKTLKKRCRPADGVFFGLRRPAAAHGSAAAVRLGLSPFFAARSSPPPRPPKVACGRFLPPLPVAQGGRQKLARGTALPLRSARASSGRPRFSRGRAFPLSPLSAPPWRLLPPQILPLCGGRFAAWQDSGAADAAPPGLAPPPWGRQGGGKPPPFLRLRRPHGIGDGGRGTGDGGRYRADKKLAKNDYGWYIILRGLPFVLCKTLWKNGRNVENDGTDNDIPTRAAGEEL